MICVGSGNEGANAGHLAGRIGESERMTDVELAVAEYESGLNIQLWKNYSDVYRIRLRSPGGQESALPASVEGGKYTLRLERTEKAGELPI